MVGLLGSMRHAVLSGRIVLFALIACACNDHSATDAASENSAKIALRADGMRIPSSANAASLPSGAKTTPRENAFSADILTRDNNILSYPKASVIWRFPKGRAKVISVCWQSDGFETQKAWVKAAVARTWEAHAGVSFAGWGTCANGGGGIRIAIMDDSPNNGPHTNGLGTQLDGANAGMVLNFTFSAWCGVTCQNNARFYIEAIAVHEFGHALAFAHEHHRPDTPGECTSKQKKAGDDGDVLWLTPYDPHSVMNYCVEPYGNNGDLSKLDIESVEAMYCPHDQPLCDPRIFAATSKPENDI
jgi:hypothetical protein